MKKAALIFSLLLMMACDNHHHKDGTSQVKEDLHEHKQDHKDTHGSANEYMRQSSVDNLIERFDSPERDAYQQPEKVMSYLGDIQGKTIIDIGAGSGYFTFKLAEKGASVIAADVDDEFQEHIKNRIEQEDLKDIETRKIPYDAPGLTEKEVDIVLMVNTYHHIENRSEYFTKVKNGTKTDGELVIIDFFKSEMPIGPPLDHKVSIDMVINELKQASYEEFEVVVDLLPYQYIVKAK